METLVRYLGNPSSFPVCCVCIMGNNLFFSTPLPRALFLKTLTHLRSNFSVLAESNNVANSNNTPSQNLFLHFVTTRFDISSADAAKMLKRQPSLGRIKTLDNVKDVASILRRFGCNEDQIASIIRSQPSLLVTSVERVVEPKLQLLKDFGMWGENPTKIETWLPMIVTSKLEVLRSNFELLRTVLPTQDLLIRAIRRNTLILGKSLQETLKPSVAFWEDFGFRGTELTLFLLMDPWVLTCTSLSPDKFDLIRRIAVPKESNMYKYVVSIVALSRIEVLEARIHNLELCGLSPEQALQVVRADPTVFKKSEENIKKKMDFMLNRMGLSADFLTKHPRMFTMSLDKVIRPRFSVLQNMTAMDGAEKLNPTRLCTMLRMKEAKFIARIIKGHPESASLWALYENAIADSSKSLKVESATL